MRFLPVDLVITASWISTAFTSNNEDGKARDEHFSCGFMNYAFYVHESLSTFCICSVHEMQQCWMKKECAFAI